MTGLKPVLDRLAGGARLNATEAAEAFATVMRGEATPAQTGSSSSGITPWSSSQSSASGD